MSANDPFNDPLVSSWRVAAAVVAFVVLATVGVILATS